MRAFVALISTLPINNYTKNLTFDEDICKLKVSAICMH